MSYRFTPPEGCSPRALLRALARRAALHSEAEALVRIAMTRDNLEGGRAFFEKREPGFTGE